MSTTSQDRAWNGAPAEGRSASRELQFLPSHLGSGIKVAIVIFGIVMIFAEGTQARKNWYEGNVAIESERLVRIQQELEQAEVQVALTAAKKNLQEEMKAVAEREVAPWLGIKQVQEGFGSALAQVAAPNMDRYKQAYESAKRRAGACVRTNACPSDEIQRVAAEQSVYRMLFYAARAAFYHTAEATSGNVQVPKVMEIE